MTNSFIHLGRRGRAGVDSRPPSPTPFARRRRGRAGVHSRPPSKDNLFIHSLS